MQTRLPIQARGVERRPSLPATATARITAADAHELRRACAPAVGRGAGGEKEKANLFGGVVRISGKHRAAKVNQVMRDHGQEKCGNWYDNAKHYLDVGR